MGRRATGTFVLAEWNAESYDEAEGAALAGVAAPKRFEGDLSATSVARLLTVHDANGKPAAYVGVERVTGTLHGRTGSFVLQHVAPGTAGEPLVIRVVPDTGTGELAGLRGDLSITGDTDGGHTYALDYELA